VQSQTLALDFRNTLTPLQRIINAFAFAGVFLDVAAGFTSLYISALLTTRVAEIKLLHSIVAGCSHRYLKEAVDTNAVAHGVRSPIGEWMFWEAKFFMQQRIDKAESNTKGQKSHDQMIELQFHTYASKFIRRVDQVGYSVIVLMHAGTASIICLLLGIICFLTSSICSAWATQPIVVSAVAVSVGTLASIYACITLVPSFFPSECA
jgi:hypothetical protein